MESDTSQWAEPELIAELKIRPAGEEAWREIFRRHDPPLRRRALFLMSGDAAKSEELTQETWLRLYKGINSFDENIPSFAPWAFTILWNTFIDGKRAHRIDDKCVPLDAPLSEGGDATYADVLSAPRAMNQETVIAIDEALDQLHPDERFVVVAFYGERMSVKEIADVMGVPTDHVDYSKRKAITKLKKYLDRPRGLAASGGENGSQH